MGQWFTPCMQVVLLFPVFPGAKTFLLIKKTDGSLYKVLEQSAAGKAGGPVVKPWTVISQAWVQTRGPALSNFRSLMLWQNFQYAID